MQKLVAEVLAAWREADRVAAEYAPGTTDHLAALEAVERLRELYAKLTGLATGDEATAAVTLAAIRVRPADPLQGT
jgi:hypothetical protein